jgi:hypothetical protein
MKKMTYFDQLRHPNWQRKRLEVMEARGFKCQDCGDSESTLNVHHKRYVKGRMAWEYDGRELEVLCEPCHEAAHHTKERMDGLFAAIPSTFYPDIMALLVGYISQSGVGTLIQLEPGKEEEFRQGRPELFFLGVLAAEMEYLLDAADSVAKEIQDRARPSFAGHLDAWQTWLQRGDEPAE